ncbi:hypothetical protein [Saccharothrix xinjiangensis]|uniref:Uncharacterized protein n=1 Tax=Saccharothrix xinjiangensis TaxID=204798 RepID=A0ABV9XUH0_9PSEU
MPHQQRKPALDLRITALLAGLATIALAILRADGLITWSWWWIFAPMWGLFLLVLLGLCAAIVRAAVTKR